MPVDSGASISIILPVFGLSEDGLFVFGGQNSLKIVLEFTLKATSQSTGGSKWGKS